jgi:hypothetical protein
MDERACSPSRRRWRRPRRASCSPTSSARSSIRPSSNWAASCARASRAATRSPTFRPIIRERDRQITGRDRRNADPVLRRYERVCFEKQYVRVAGPRGRADGQPAAPRHPLMQAVTDIVLEQHRNKLKQGTVLVDPNDMGLTPKVMFIIDHSVKEGADPPTWFPAHAVRRDRPQGNAINAGWAPHLDLEPSAPADLALIKTCWRAVDHAGPGAGGPGARLHPPRARALRRSARAPREDTSTRRWPPSTSAWSRKSTTGPTATSSCRTTSPPARMCA